MKKTYLDILTILRNSGDKGLYVAVIYENNRWEWLPVDKNKYIQLLDSMGNAREVPYPCYFEVEPDGEMFIHPKMEND